jgi:tRNA(fMet)-specific endonuclease VapC
MYPLDWEKTHFFKGEGRVAQHLLAIPPSEIGIPAIVLYEIEVGIAKSTSPQKRKAQLEEFLSLVNIIPFGGAEARIAASLRARLESQGRPIGPYDVLIAAAAAGLSLIPCATGRTQSFGGFLVPKRYGTYTARLSVTDFVSPLAPFVCLCHENSHDQAYAKELFC